MMWLEDPLGALLRPILRKQHTCSALLLSSQAQVLWVLDRHIGRFDICPSSSELPFLMISFDRNSSGA